MARHTQLVFSSLIAGMLALAGSVVVLAQGACPGPECPYVTPTQIPFTATPSPTPTGTREYAPTPTPDPNQPTATGVPMPAGEEFPIPNYPMPTSIPTITLPNVPDQPGDVPMPDIPAPATFTPMTTPQPLSITTSLSPTESFEGSYGGYFPAAGEVMTYTPGITGLNGTVGETLGQGGGLTGGIISYTTWLSGQVEALQGTDDFTLTTAPDWYAPQLPRDIANVGWTFEQLNTAAGKRYSIQTWAAMFGSIVAMPVKLSLNLWELFRFFGPLGLFVIWLLIMAALVFNLDVLGTLIRSAKSVYNFMVATFNVLSIFLQWLWQFVMWVMDWTWIIVNWIIDWVYKLLNLLGNWMPGT